MMKLVTRLHIEAWAKRIDSKGDLPYLISRLVRATTPASTRIDIPSGSAAYVGGWDGVVISEVETDKVPKGTSLLEFGTEAGVKGKADKDYAKRKENPLGHDPTKSVFIFITPRFWKKKDKWVNEKKAEGFWRDVRVYDSLNLEQWLDSALATARWFAGVVGSFPFDGIMTAQEFWEEWSTGPAGILLDPKLVTAGREYQSDQLLNTLQGQPTIKGIKASTKNEAIAFIIASAKLFPQSEMERFFARSLIVDTEGNYRGIQRNTSNLLNFIPRFDEAQPLYVAVANGHHVLVPLGPDDDFNQETIILPTIDRDGQIESLIKSGISREDSEKYSRESGRNITILKKLIGFPHFGAKWLGTENIRELLPALIVGRWNESHVGDVEIIEQLSGQEYIKYQATLQKWKNFSDAPIIQIGASWRLTSPLDLWNSMSHILTRDDLQNLKKSILDVYEGGNPEITPATNNPFDEIFSKKRKYSQWVRDGLAQSLILVARFGNGFQISQFTNPQDWVDGVVDNLLLGASSDFWVSLDQDLPLISEASPNAFLNAVSQSLSKENPEIMKMFEEVDGPLHSVSYHTGLLWALEGLAWMPEYLMQTGLILLKLARLDPGGNISNRPINSINEIFKPWHYQTLASFEERMEILELITEKEEQTGWKLLLGMLPNARDIAKPTHKMRWRIFDKNLNLQYTYEEIEKTHTHVVNQLINNFDHSEAQFSQLLNESMSLKPRDREKVLSWAESVYTEVQHKENITWATLRNLLNLYRSRPGIDRIEGKPALDRLENLYRQLTPNNVIDREIWLFNEHWPGFPEGFLYDEINHEQQEKKIDAARIKAIDALLTDLGLQATVDLRRRVSQPWIFGTMLARVVKNREQVVELSACLNDEKEYLPFIQAFFSYIESTEGLSGIQSLYDTLKSIDYSPEALTNIFIFLSQSMQLWDYLESLNPNIQKAYWQDMMPRFYELSVQEKVFGIQKLMEHRRFVSATVVASQYVKDLPSSLLIIVLGNVATEKTSENIRLDGYRVDRIFKELDNRTDVDQKDLVNLEWLHLPLLDSYSTNRQPNILQDELAKNPSFFVDILRWIYPSEKSEILAEENKGLDELIIQNRAKHAYHLLNSWKKVPGVKLDNSINQNELDVWISTARNKAQQYGRLKVADMHIGKILAQYPENIPQWPQEKIFQIIERINSASLNSNYSAELFNKRGSSSRGVFDGGDIERRHAEYFQELSDRFKNKYSIVSKIFADLAKGYHEDAKMMDDEAEKNRLEY